MFQSLFLTSGLALPVRRARRSRTSLVLQSFLELRKIKARSFCMEAAGLPQLGRTQYHGAGARVGTFVTAYASFALSAGSTAVDLDQRKPGARYDNAKFERSVRCVTSSCEPRCWPSLNMILALTRQISESRSRREW